MKYIASSGSSLHIAAQYIHVVSGLRMRFSYFSAVISHKAINRTGSPFRSARNLLFNNINEDPSMARPQDSISRETTHASISDRTMWTDLICAAQFWVSKLHTFSIAMGENPEFLISGTGIGDIRYLPDQGEAISGRPFRPRR
jgi:hypothetical protein